ISTAASLPLDRTDERCLPLLQERSRRAPRLWRSRCSLQSPMADHRRCEGERSLGAEALRSLVYWTEVLRKHKGSGKNKSCTRLAPNLDGRNRFVVNL